MSVLMRGEQKESRSQDRRLLEDRKSALTSSPITVSASEANFAAASSGADATSFRAWMAPISWKERTTVSERVQLTVSLTRRHLHWYPIYSRLFLRTEVTFTRPYLLKRRLSRYTVTSAYMALIHSSGRSGESEVCLLWFGALGWCCKVARAAHLLLLILSAICGSPRERHDVPRHNNNALEP